MKKYILLTLISCMLLMVCYGCAPHVEEPAEVPAEETIEETAEEATEEASETSTDEITDVSPAEAAALREWLDIPYADQSEAQKLDVYLPETGEAPFPVIISIHGGGFKYGDKSWNTPEREGVNRGYAVVCVNYRLSDEAIFPAAVYDVKAAVRFIKANAKEYHLDAEKLAAWGGSAGGYLVSILGTSAGVEELEDLEMGNADQTSNVHAVVDFFGAINLATVDEQMGENGSEEFVLYDPNNLSALFLGARIADIPNTVVKADPTTYISEDDPPFFIEHGTMDEIVSIKNSINFANALTDVLGEDKVTYIELEGAGHGTDEFKTEENLDKVFDFLDTIFK